jgi:hypothetical protein
MIKQTLRPSVLPTWGRKAATLTLVLVLTWSWNNPLFASEPCETGGNVIPKEVCDFDSFYGSPPRQLPNGWQAFILSGDLTYMQDVDTYWGPPALRMWSNGGTFKAGIYTQVRVTPGAGYRASISWGGPNAPDHFGRQLGIDPTGGTDPNAPTVIWGPMHFGPGRILNYTNGRGPNIDVRARAQSETITVFFLVDHPTSTGDNLIFVDAIALYPDESAPALDPSTPTPAPTNPPATEPPVAALRVVPVEPTATWTPQPTATPTITPTPTETPTPTATPSPTPSPTATPSPTWTPWATATPGIVININDSASGGIEGLRTLADDMARQRGRNGLLLIGLVGLSGASLCGSSLWWLRRRQGSRQADLATLTSDIGVVDTDTTVSASID